MSEIQRHRINPVAWEDGKGWARQLIHSKPKVHAIEQPHKKGECSEFCSECKIDDLERQLAEARELVTEADEYLDTNELTTICHGSILHQKFKQLKEKGDE